MQKAIENAERAHAVSEFLEKQKREAAEVCFSFWLFSFLFSPLIFRNRRESVFVRLKKKGNLLLSSLKIISENVSCKKKRKTV